MRQEELHILVKHSQNQKPVGNLDKSHIDITHTFFHLSSPIPRDCMKTDSCQLIQTLSYHWMQCIPTSPIPRLCSLAPSRGELEVDPPTYLRATLQQL